MTIDTLRPMRVPIAGSITKNASDFLFSTETAGFTYIRRDGQNIRVNIDQLWFWSDEWQEGESRVEQYIKEGNVKTFGTVEEFLRSLRE